MKSFFEMYQVVARQRLLRELGELNATGGAVTQGTGGAGSVGAAPAPPPPAAKPAPMGTGTNPTKATANPIGINPLEGLTKTLETLRDEIKKVKEYAQASGNQPPPQLAQLDMLMQQMGTLMKQMGGNGNEIDKQGKDAEAAKANLNTPAPKPPAAPPGPPPAPAVPGGAQAQ